MSLNISQTSHSTWDIQFPYWNGVPSNATLPNLIMEKEREMVDVEYCGNPAIH